MRELTAAFAKYATKCLTDPSPNVRPMHHGSDEFRQIIAAAITEVPRYALPASPTKAHIVVREVDAYNHLADFLARTSFHETIGQPGFDPAEFAQRLCQEAGRPDCSVTSVVPLDGLELGQNELEFSGGRFVRLTEEFLNAFLENKHVDGAGRLGRFGDMFALLTTATAPNPPWGATRFEWASASRQVEDLAQPWLNLTNLWSADKASASGVFQKCDSLLVYPHVRALGIQEPARDYETVDSGDDLWEDETPAYRVRIDDGGRFQRFVETLELRIREARAKTHRVDTALRFFARVASPFWQHHVLGYGDDSDVNEDIIIDAVTGLEAVFLTGEQRGKGQLLGQRAGVLLEEDPESRRKLRKAVERVYALRSAILHGDARRDEQDLRDGVPIAEDVLRRSLVAFIMLSGDHQAVVSAVGDDALAAANRALARL